MHYLPKIPATPSHQANPTNPVETDQESAQKAVTIQLAVPIQQTAEDIWVKPKPSSPSAKRLRKSVILAILASVFLAGGIVVFCLWHKAVKEEHEACEAAKMSDDCDMLYM